MTSDSEAPIIDIALFDMESDLFEDVPALARLTQVGLLVVALGPTNDTQRGWLSYF
ncbi:hypothetical protein [Burkholderia sp. Ac-20353]|uniref:hypothetical protein n=1 Tax=Burkholderia sp. Ac-20353 TaxID=2703894 RepID=UPI00197B4A4E|nr:hypothetical protein [Burkholderia sp. Ac-20353]MBN3791302.1 hypothetical protein [Burkholderia sp. Ac-20353]